MDRAAGNGCTIRGVWCAQGQQGAAHETFFLFLLHGGLGLMDLPRPVAVLP